jgi:hypothetical protein
VPKYRTQENTAPSLQVSKKVPPPSVMRLLAKTH